MTFCSASVISSGSGATTSVMFPEGYLRWGRAASPLPDLHRRPARRAVRDHPGRAGDWRAPDDRAPAPRLHHRRGAAALAGPRGLGALPAGARRGPPAGARGGRWRAGHPRRGAAPVSRLRHRPVRAAAPAPAHTGAHPPRPRPQRAEPDHPRLRADRARPGRLPSPVGPATPGRGRPRGRRRRPPGPAPAVISPEDEQIQPPEGAGFSESVTFAFGDPGEELYGSARLGLSAGGGAALALLFSAGGLVASAPDAGLGIANPSWAPLSPGGVGASIGETPGAGTVTYDGDEGGFELTFTATAAPLELTPDSRVGKIAGLRGYEQLCTVTGTVTAGGRERRVSCLGQRSHQWGAADWEKLALTRSLSLWCAPDLAVSLAGVRPANAKAHDAEAVDAWLIHPVEEGIATMMVDDPRLSTAFDGSGRQKRAGLELWLEPETDDEEGGGAPPLRAAGEVVCGTSLDLGRATLHAAFFHWRMQGAEGVGRYDVLRRDA